jgi:hypothetical protein
MSQVACTGLSATCDLMSDVHLERVLVVKFQVEQFIGNSIAMPLDTIGEQ